MVQLKSLLAAAALAAAASATPLAEPQPGWWARGKCLSPSVASGLVEGFGSLISAFTNATADSLLAPDFTDTSDSINFLAGEPEGAVTFPSKLAFELGQGAQQPIPFTVINIDAVTCNTVAFRWFVTIGPKILKGINVFVASFSGDTSLGVDGWQIETNFSEFNSGLWLEAIGGTCTPPPPPSPAK
jgi:hypothetical protein